MVSAAMHRCVLVMVIAMFGAALASSGDQSNEFSQCVEQCECATHRSNILVRVATLTIFWDCDAECGYQCQFTKDQQRFDQGKSRMQYFGNWAFTRVFGCDQFVSFVLSALNLAVHVLGLQSLQKLVSSKQHFLQAICAWSWASQAWWLLAGVHHATWRNSRVSVWSSAASHTAGAVAISTALIVVVIRSLKLDADKSRAFKTAGGVLTLMWIVFSSWSDIDRWMPWLLIVYSGCWAKWLVDHHLETRRAFMTHVVKHLALFGLAGVFEWVDFAPVFGLVDSHAISVGLMAASSHFLYEFLLADCLFSRASKGHDVEDSVWARAVELV